MEVTLIPGGILWPIRQSCSHQSQQSVVTAVTCAFVNLQHHQVKFNERPRFKWASRGISNLSLFVTHYAHSSRIYRELGQGKRVSLAKLASDSFVKEERPLRIAIDIAIWQFQTQAAQGTYVESCTVRTATNYCRRNQPGNSNTLLPYNSPPSNPRRTDLRLRWTPKTYIQAKQAIRSWGWCC